MPYELLSGCEELVSAFGSLAKTSNDAFRVMFQWLSRQFPDTTIGLRRQEKGVAYFVEWAGEIEWGPVEESDIEQRIIHNREQNLTKQLVSFPRKSLEVFAGYSMLLQHCYANTENYFGTIVLIRPITGKKDIPAFSKEDKALVAKAEFHFSTTLYVIDGRKADKKDRKDDTWWRRGDAPPFYTD